MTLFQLMCVAAGCDYLKNLKGIGIHHAFQMAPWDGDMLNLMFFVRALRFWNALEINYYY